MKKKIYLLSVAILFGTLSLAQELDPQMLVGEWKVDLRPTPDAEPYFQKLIISKVGDNQIEGTFYYDSEILHSAINTSWDTLAFTFVTEDNSGFYNTSVQLVGNKLRGTTHSIGRSFVSVWTAEKVE